MGGMGGTKLKGGLQGSRNPCVIECADRLLEQTNPSNHTDHELTALIKFGAVTVFSLQFF